MIGCQTPTQNNSTCFVDFCKKFDSQHTLSLVPNGKSNQHIFRHKTYMFPPIDCTDNGLEKVSARTDKELQISPSTALASYAAELTSAPIGWLVWTTCHPPCHTHHPKGSSFSSNRPRVQISRVWSILYSSSLDLHHAARPRNND